MDLASVMRQAADALDFARAFVQISINLSSAALGLPFLLENYGLTGAIIFVFGSGPVWIMQFDTINSGDHQAAMHFRKLVQDESTMVAVAAAIFAQVAITALSLPNLSNISWTSKGCFTFSLVTAVMSVYYASNQYQAMGRLFTGERVSDWISGSKKRIIAHQRELPEELQPFSFQQTLPSASAVLLVSAPSNLLSASVCAFLAGLGVYFGSTWTQSLDNSLGDQGSRAVFITYIVGLSTCVAIYLLSSLVQGKSNFVYGHYGLFREKLMKRFQSEFHKIGHPGLQENINLPVPIGEDASREPLKIMDLRTAFREAARARREMARIDGRIAELLASPGTGEYGGESSAPHGSSL